MPSAIEATGLVKRYGAVTALDGVDVRTPRGTVLGLLGPNGAGKTTIVRILATLLRPDAGSATITTGAGLAEDVQKGIVDRFRSLPMASSAVLAGRTLSDVVNNVIALAVMSVTGLIVGWRVRGSLLDALWAFVLLLILGYATSWVMAFLGLLIPSPEVIGSAPYLVIFPLTSLANTFVPLTTMPAPLRIFAEWNPISAVTQAARDLFGNPDPNPTAPVSTAWPMEHPQLYTLLWAVVIVAVFAPLASAQYRRTATR